MEVWRDIPGYEGIYQASNTGLIRTAPGKVTSNRHSSRRVWKVRVLKAKVRARPKGGKKDYRVSLWKDGKESTVLVARAVAMAWVPGYEPGLTVNHIDGNPENNAASNLEWVSHADNNRHAFAAGLMTSCKRARLVDENGAYVEFPSMAEADRYLERHTGYLSNCVKRGRIAKDRYGERFKIEIC